LVQSFKFKNKKVFAFAGIGNPQNFFTLLKENNINVEKTYSFPDHHNYSQKDFDIIIKKDVEKIITTEKDYYKIKDFNFKEIDYLKVESVIKKKEQFLEKIQEFYA